MKRRLFLMATVVAALPSLVLAEDPTKLNVALTTALAAAPAEVWSVIGDFQDMSWHPAIHATTGSGGNEVAATRQLVLGAKGGPTIDEVLDTYDAESMSYGYRITDVKMEVLPVADYASQLTVTPRDEGGSIVEWRGTFHRGNPDALNDAAAIGAIEGVYQAGLDALTARFGAPES